MIIRVMIKSVKTPKCDVKLKCIGDNGSIRLTAEMSTSPTFLLSRMIIPKVLEFMFPLVNT
jgi:hypothetical protein